ncbi:MAG: hypothetical protein ACREJ2_16910, partial [Planctomycetota bacterium]
MADRRPPADEAHSSAPLRASPAGGVTPARAKGSASRGPLAPVETERNRRTRGESGAQPVPVRNRPGGASRSNLKQVSDAPGRSSGATRVPAEA